MRNLLYYLPYIALVSSAPPYKVSDQPVVSINNGTVVGVRSSTFDQDFFLGIPYAQPPVGNLRFRPPRSINESWHERQASSYGAWCHSAPLQLPGFSQNNSYHQEDEDCLTINIVRPHGVTQYSKIPVLVWIYGGGLQEGGSADQRYNSSYIVQQSVRLGMPIVHVSFNYRLSGFGFLSGRALVGSGNANLGLYDQRLALHWIQENIGAFGGDPSRVTIQGESAGAHSVGYHFMAYDGRDDALFRAGIAESGGPMFLVGFLSPDQQDVLYEDVLNSTNCKAKADSIPGL
ncbi:hypothetical protein AA0117_g13336 [Alternaria alternata]|uniref:Carboxylic ester hydrolase n=1 Tax=Alternaria alternata TaxID=5599 RepID=A0A4Q4MKG2_ALTAL|nr:hypothetical protein AA0117_g13336 [Alternaria alternata]